MQVGAQKFTMALLEICLKNNHIVIFDLYGKDYMQQSYLDKLNFTFW